MYIENRPIENPELLVALKMLAEDPSKENQLRIGGTMVMSTLLIPATVDTPNDQANRKIGFVLLKSPDGDNFVPAFSDWSHALAWNSSQCAHAAVMTFKEYADIILSNDNEIKGLILNPGSDSVVFSRHQIELLKNVAESSSFTSSGKAQPGSSQIMLGDLPSYPDDLINALSEALSKEPDVLCAYISAMKVMDAESWLLIIKPDGNPGEICGGEPKIMFDRIINAVRQYTHGKPLSVSFDNIPIAQQAIINKEPFYVKNSGFKDF